jgi:hypothetical protein
MRKLFWVLALAIGAVVVKKQWGKRVSQRREAEESAARSNWSNEGGAPGPAGV